MRMAPDLHACNLRSGGDPAVCPRSSPPAPTGRGCNGHTCQDAGMAQSHAAWEKRVRGLVESLMGSDSEPLRWDVLDFLKAGEHGLAIETLSDWIGDLDDPVLVSPAGRAQVLDLVSDFPEETQTRVRRALADHAGG
ncbi:MafI family immunity protein [Streptomyces sp900116325]|uniref:MafI family immunity protein n=1 Tax=Streptomyces sp. 900116325 TaxID=3154295 RepID=A0ABV2UMR0_9ACTN